MKIPRDINKLISYILSLYIAGFFLYNLLPFSYFEIYVEPKENLAPKPFVKKYYYLLGLKSNYQPSKDKTYFFKSKGINFIFGFFPFQDDNFFRNFTKAPECNLVFISEINALIKLANFIFEYIPKKIFRSEFYSYATFINTDKNKCNVLVTDIYIPKHFIDFYIDTSRNMTYTRLFKSIDLSKNLIINVSKKVDIYGFSPRSFYFPDESTVYPFKLFVRSNEEKVLIIVYRNGQVYRVYDTDRIVIRINREGVYAVEVYRYKLRWKGYYFGLRLVAFSSPITLLY